MAIAKGMIRGELNFPLPLSGAAANVVKMSDRDLRQTRILPVPKCIPFALQNSACG
jgi:hypothetical protein